MVDRVQGDSENALIGAFTLSKTRGTKLGFIELDSYLRVRVDAIMSWLPFSQRNFSATQIPLLVVSPRENA